MNNDFKRIGQGIRATLRPALFLVSLTSLAFAQTPERSQGAATGNASNPRLGWWTLGERVVPERGKFAELKSLKKVYVNVSLSDEAAAFQSLTTADRVNVQQAEIHRAIAELVQTNSSLQVVGSGDLADFAMLVRVSTESAPETSQTNFSLTLDAETATIVEVTVLVPGAKRQDGSTRPRQVWQELSPNSQTELIAAARFTVDGFLWELRKLSEAKKK